MSNTSVTPLDPRAQRWGTAAKIAALLAVGFLVAPYIWMAIGGLIGLIVAVAIVGAAWFSRDWVFMAAANARLSLIKKEASKNPVETLQEVHRTRTIELDQRKTAIEQLAGQIRNFEQQVGDIGHKYGKEDRDYIRFSNDLVNLRKVYAHRVEKWKEAAALLGQFKEQIERADMIWKAGCAAAAARESSGYTEKDWLNELKTDTALDSINANYNAALASLDSSLDTPVNTR